MTRLLQVICIGRAIALQFKILLFTRACNRTRWTVGSTQTYRRKRMKIKDVNPHSCRTKNSGRTNNVLDRVSDCTQASFLMVISDRSAPGMVAAVKVEGVTNAGIDRLSATIGEGLSSGDNLIVGENAPTIGNLFDLVTVGRVIAAEDDWRGCTERTIECCQAVNAR